MAEIVIVLLPGMDGTGLLFGPLAEAIGGGLQTVTVSYPPDIPLSYRELLPLVRSALPREAPYLLIGESFSGPLALMLAAEGPPNLKALLLVSTFIRNPIRWIPKRAGALASPAVFRLSSRRLRNPLWVALPAPRLWMQGAATPAMSLHIV